MSELSPFSAAIFSAPLTLAYFQPQPAQWRLPPHEAEGLSELRQILDLAAQVAWWRALAAWVLGACGLLLALLVLLAWAACLITGNGCGCCLRRRPPQPAVGERARELLPPPGARKVQSMS